MRRGSRPCSNCGCTRRTPPFRYRLLYRWDNGVEDWYVFSTEDSDDPRERLRTVTVRDFWKEDA